jgi:hypothetical protein
MSGVMACAITAEFAIICTSDALAAAKGGRDAKMPALLRARVGEQFLDFRCPRRSTGFEWARQPSAT